MSMAGRTRAAVEAWLHADTADGDLGPGTDFDGWGSLDARRFRYTLAWSLYQNTAFRDMHRWAAEYRKTLGLYAHIRNIFNPVDRIVEFHAAHIYGGSWDHRAGDGMESPSSVPIVGERATDALRLGIARVWRDSLWSQNIETWVRNGALFGDAPVKVVLDNDRGKVLFEVVHPKHVKYVEFDRNGHVKGYVIEEGRVDPRLAFPERHEAVADSKQVKYEERCEQEGDSIVWRTYLVDGGTAIPWNWSAPNGSGSSEWSAPFGFVPMVWTRHVDLGLGFGLPEYHTARPKIVELDDQASKLNDQIRKVVEPKWLFTGMRAPRPNAAGDSILDLGRKSNISLDGRESERDEEGAIYARNDAAKAQALIADLPIGDVGLNIDRLMEEIEKGFPELRFDRMRAGGDVSGESLRVARQPVETKINRRRARYDPNLVRLNQMALAIGGWAYRENGGDARFAVFAPFDLGSYAAGVLDHQIGERVVFGEDPSEAADLRRRKYESIEVAIRAGLPWRTAMAEAGYTEDQIGEMESAKQEEAARNAEKMAAFRATAGLDNDNEEDNGDEVTEEDFEAA